MILCSLLGYGNEFKLIERTDRKRSHTNETRDNNKGKKSFSTSLANSFQEIIKIVPFPTKMSGCEDSPNLDNLMDAYTHSLIACSSDKHKTTQGYPSSLHFPTAAGFRLC